MNQYILILLAGCIIFFTNQMRAGEIEDFVEDLNLEWASKNYTNMYQVIDDRLVTHTNDLSALLLKMNYYLMVEYNLSLAQGDVSIFTNTLSSLDWSADPTAKTISMGMINEVVNPAEAQGYGVVYGLSSNQLEAVHAQSPTNHPLTDFIMRIEAVQYNQ